VLLVQRCDGGLFNWQFRAGVVEPDDRAERVAVLETEVETAIGAEVLRR
jgi:hypothetical protein